MVQIKKGYGVREPVLLHEFEKLEMPILSDHFFGLTGFGFDYDIRDLLSFNVCA